MWDNVWDKVFSDNEWGKYPPEQLIRFMARNFYNVPDRKNLRVLEIGSGTGANLWYLAREGFGVTGIDGSSVGVNKALKRLKSESLKADVIVGDVTQLPLPDSTFDCVIDVECLYANSYKDAKCIISEVRRVLKPNGKFFSCTFMTGTSGDGSGKKLRGEENTYIDLEGGSLRKDTGITRFTSEEEIKDLYGVFNIDSIDYIKRSDEDRKYEIKEWVIVCSKQ